MLFLFRPVFWDWSHAVAYEDASKRVDSSMACWSCSDAPPSPVLSWDPNAVVNTTPSRSDTIIANNPATLSAYVMSVVAEGKKKKKKL